MYTGIYIYICTFIFAYIKAGRVHKKRVRGQEVETVVKARSFNAFFRVFEFLNQKVLSNKFYSVMLCISFFQQHLLVNFLFR